MAAGNELTDDLVRELYARFGLAYYYSEVLHRGLCLGLAISGLPRMGLVTRPRIEERLSHAFSLTLGDVIKELLGKIPDEYSIKLEKALGKRNFLAHHFWFDRAHLMFRAKDVQQLIEELDGYSELFKHLDEETTRYFRKSQLELGLTDEVLQDALSQILSGQAEESLPGKKAVMELEKKLKRKQRLVRVWEPDLPEAEKPLVFEMEDGTLWQLCDEGLGWTRFQKVEPGWVEHPDVKPYLPAEILLRPEDAKPWEYQFKLKGEAVLWVKSGKYERTFQWGLKTKQRSTDRKSTPDPNKGSR